MKHILALCLLFLLPLINCLAQSDFRRGYIITQDNDTLQGYIDYIVNNRNIKECRFKPQIDDESTIYTLDDIKAFRYENANYFVALSVNAEQESGEEKYFVEQLIDGIADVFHYSDDQGTHYLIRKEDGELYELKNTRAQVEIDGKTYTKKKREYIRVLRYLYQDSPSTMKRMDDLDLDQNSLINLAEFYHNDVCSEYECLIYAKNKRYIEFTWGVYAGYTLSAISFQKVEYMKGLNSNFSKGNSPTFGILLNVKDPYISERWSLQLETMFLNAGYYTDSTEINIGYLKVPITLKYTYPGEKVKTSLQLGLAYNKWIKFADEGIVSEIQENNAIQKRRYQYGILTGVKLSFPFTQKTNLFVQGRYEYYGGKHFNQWYLFDYYGKKTRAFGDSVRSRTNFLNLTAGITF